MKSLLPPELQAAWNVRDTVSRRERMAELAFAGYAIPRCGRFTDMARLGIPLVVYTDPFAHCGEGKSLWKPGDSPLWSFDAFCSEYLRPKNDGLKQAVSRRRLIMGYFECHLEYTSSTSWMSNVGGEYWIYVRPMELPGLRKGDLLPYPMYAVDEVWNSDDDGHMAVDLNVCPGVPLEVVNAVGRDKLAESVARFCRDRGLIS